MSRDAPPNRRAGGPGAPAGGATGGGGAPGREGAVPRTGPRPVGEVLRALLQRRRYVDHMHIHRIRIAWPEIVGPVLAAHSTPLALRGGRLTVGVADSVWLQELSFLKAEMLERVNACLEGFAQPSGHGGDRSGRAGRPVRSPAAAGGDPARPGRGAPAAPRVTEVRLRLARDSVAIASDREAAFGGASASDAGAPLPGRDYPVPDELAESLSTLERHLEDVPDPDLRRQIRRAYIRCHLPPRGATGRAPEEASRRGRDVGGPGA